MSDEDAHGSGPPDNRDRPTGSGAAQEISEGARSSTNVPDAADYLAQLRRRRAAASRLSVLDCGCGDPWHAGHLEPSRRNAIAARHAWLHLRDHGLLDDDGLITDVLAEGVA